MSRLNLLRCSWLGPVAAIPIALVCFLSIDPAEIFTSWRGFCSQIVIAAAGMAIVYHFASIASNDTACLDDDTIIRARLRVEVLEMMIADVTAARRTIIDHAVDSILSGSPTTPKLIDDDDDAI